MSTPNTPVSFGEGGEIPQMSPDDLPSIPYAKLSPHSRYYPDKEYPPYDPSQMDVDKPYRDKLPGTQKFWMDTITSSKPEVPIVSRDVLPMPQAKVPGTMDAPAMGYPSVQDVFKRQQDDQLNMMLKRISIMKTLQNLQSGFNI